MTGFHALVRGTSSSLCLSCALQRIVLYVGKSKQETPRIPVRSVLLFHAVLLTVHPLVAGEEASQGGPTCVWNNRGEQGAGFSRCSTTCSRGALLLPCFLLSWCPSPTLFSALMAHLCCPLFCSRLLHQHIMCMYRARDLIRIRTDCVCRCCASTRCAFITEHDRTIQLCACAYEMQQQLHCTCLLQAVVQTCIGSMRACRHGAFFDLFCYDSPSCTRLDPAVRLHSNVSSSAEPIVVCKLFAYDLLCFCVLVQNVTDRDTCLQVQMPHPFIESCYKGIYLTFVRCCKFTNPNVKEGQTFMAQCVVELFGLDFNVAYEV